MAFYLEFRRLFEIQTGYFPIPEGEVMLTFNDEGEIVTPSMIWIEPATSGVHQEDSDFDPGEKTVYLLDCFYTTGFYVGSTIITDVKLKKN